MIKALITKELRETSGIALAAAAFYLLLVAYSIGLPVIPWSGGGGGIPFLNGTFEFNYACLSAGFALALGFRQTVGEGLRGTWLFLLHRPVPRRGQIAVKLLVGMTVYLACGTIPILLFGWWAATPGTHASPFEWSMTEPAWCIWLAMILVYLASFVSGLRPAWWVGSRLLPLAAAGTVVFLLTIATAGTAFFAAIWPWAILWLGGLVVVAAWLVTNVATVAGMRDYP